MSSTYWFSVLLLIANTLYLSNAISDPEFDALKIIGGDETDADDYRYVVGINCNKKSCLCTGSIIDERYIVSAAHCFFNEVDESFRIVAGTNDVSRRGRGRVERDVEKIYIPAGYNRTNTYADDIAVLKLEKSLQLKKNNLEKLRLPAKTRTKYAGKQAVLLGFGAAEITLTVKKDGTGKENTHPNSVLHSADVAIVPNNKCNDDFVVSTNLCGRVIKDKSVIHYGGCSGDSGGPLVYKSKVLIGLYINGPFGCNERNDYGIYTSVKSYTTFIEKAMLDDTRGMIVQHH